MKKFVKFEFSIYAADNVGRVGRVRGPKVLRTHNCAHYQLDLCLESVYCVDRYIIV